MSNDVEKRWHDPRGLRAAIKYVVAVVGVAALLVIGALLWANTDADQCIDAEFFVCRDPERLLFLMGPPTVLLLGGLGAFVQTYRVWKTGGVWPIWQGAGWALFVLMLVYLTGSAGVLRS